MKTRPMGAELFHVDGRMDREAGRQTDGYNKKIVVAFRNFRKAPTQQKCSHLDII